MSALSTNNLSVFLICTLGFSVVSCYQYNIIVLNKVGLYVLNKVKKLILVENTDKVIGIGFIADLMTGVSWTIRFIKSKAY